MILHVDPHAPLWVRAAADTLLYAHIGGGMLGVISGGVALVAPKGARLHRLAGTVFFVSMLVMSGIGAAVSPFLPTPAWPNVAAGVMTFYLVVTAWSAVRSKRPGAARLDRAMLVVPVLVALAGASFIVMASRDPSGTVDGGPPQAFYVFVAIGSIAAFSDLNVILRGGVTGAQRIARHLWRMCAALTIASGSFFLGQQQMMPHLLRGSAVLFVPVLAPLLLLFFWLIRVRLTSGFRHEPVAA